MYYSKNSSLSIPQNYHGNAFRVIDESNRTYPPKNVDEPITKVEQSKCENSQSQPPSKSEAPLISSLLSGVCVEDLLLLGLIFVIHDESPNDPILFLLLLLLLAK